MRITPKPTRPRIYIAPKRAYKKKSAPCFRCAFARILYVVLNVYTRLERQLRELMRLFKFVIRRSASDSKSMSDLHESREFIPFTDNRTAAPDDYYCRTIKRRATLYAIRGALVILCKQRIVHNCYHCYILIYLFLYPTSVLCSRRHKRSDVLTALGRLLCVRHVVWKKFNRILLIFIIRLYRELKFYL